MAADDRSQPPAQPPAPSVVGPVSLVVPFLASAVAFYRDGLGLTLRRRTETSAALGTRTADLVVLEARPAAPRPRRATGLFHLAILVPTRRDLARALRHLAESRVPFQGFADHLVSEALYLADPAGNGIEIYRDRPREEWIYDGGALRMATDPLDTDGLLRELAGDREPWAGMAPETTMGHVHLRVADLAAAEAFYRDILGFDLTTRYGSSAAFLSKHGYHHHIGLNTWESLGAPAPPAGALGLQAFHLRVPQDEASRIRAAAVERGLEVVEVVEGFQLPDPSGNAVIVKTAA